MSNLNPRDGDQIADLSGNVYQYNAEEDSYIKIGVLSNPAVASVTNNGIITPAMYQQLSSLGQAAAQGLFKKTKLFLGEYPDNPYFYLLHSTDDLIKFTPEVLIDGSKRLRLEVDRARLSQRLARTPCIGLLGSRGPKGDNGAHGLAANNEQIYTVTGATPALLKLNALVSHPITEPISVRLDYLGKPFLELFVAADGSSWEYRSDYLVLDRSKSSVQYKGRDLSISLVPSGSVFDTAAGAYTFKARQRGATGTKGLDGSPLIELVGQSFNDQSTEVIVTMRLALDRNITYVPVQVSKEVVTGNLMLLSNKIPVKQFPEAVAVNYTVEDQKPVCYYRFADTEVKFPDIHLPSWMPTKSCADRRRYAISSFRWFDRIDRSQSQDNCLAITIPFDILVGPQPPIQCCKDDFFLCPNLGDRCFVEFDTMMTAPQPPEPPDESSSSSSATNSSSGSSEPSSNIES